MKKIIEITRFGLIALMTMLALPGCARNKTQQVEEEIRRASVRFNDAPPVVDASRRYHLPVDTHPALSGNYGELRPNHFHGGLDFKTDQTIGHPVYAFSDGYVRRVGINAYGYGLVLYVEHPDLGLTSVYGHLDTFSKKVWRKVRERQVNEELNNCDINFGPDELPVKYGEVIALSGNTGSSGGPHVHFELRNIPDDDNDICYDPMMFFLKELKDTKAPRISHVYLYPQAGEGLANGMTTRQISPVTGICATQGGIGGALSKPFTAWGRVGLALKAYDYMDGQHNKYGVKDLKLLMRLDGEFAENGEPLYQVIYRFRQDAFRFSENRFNNTVTDYASWVERKSMIMKSFIEPGNFLQQVDPSVGDGIVDINEERNYHFVYELTDAHGNFTSLDFDIRGVPPAEPIPAVHHTEAFWAEAMQPFEIDSAGCHFRAAPGVFYTDVDFRFSIADRAQATRTVTKYRKNRRGRRIAYKAEEKYDVPCVSKVYTLGQHDVPMHTWCDMSIEMPADVAHPEQLYLSNVDGEGSVRKSHFEAAQKNQPARMTGQIREGGRYAVRRDAKGPEVTLSKTSFQKIELEIVDEGSGLRHHKVTIDGKFVPFNMDNTGHYFGEPCNYGIASGRNHKIEVYAVDRCGNETRVSYEKNF